MAFSCLSLHKNNDMKIFTWILYFTGLIPTDLQNQNDR